MLPSFLDKFTCYPNEEILAIFGGVECMEMP
jgi:hypothetical protein